MAAKECIQVPGMKALGPYSQAVRAGGMVYVSGQAGINPATGEAAGPDFSTQARQAFENLKAVVVAAGSRLDLVVNTTILMRNAEDFAELNRLFAEYFPANPPARMTPVVTIPRGLLISIGCVAVSVAVPRES